MPPSPRRKTLRLNFQKLQNFKTFLVAAAKASTSLRTRTVLVAHTWATSAMAEKPSVLIIGGLGYIGRFLALYIQQNNLASEVRIVDKVLPQLAWLAPEFAEACSQDKFMQADASKEREFPNPHFTIFCGSKLRNSRLRADPTQLPSPAFLIAPTADSGTMSLTVVARQDIHRRMRFIRCARWH